MELNKFYNMDCMEYMKTVPDKFFELAIVDPEYGININNNMGRRRGDLPSNYKKIEWDKKPPDKKYFKELFRISKNQIIWGGNYFGLKPNKCFIIWDKLFSNDVSFSTVEYAWASFNETSKLFKFATVKRERIHPTQKPIALYRWLLQNYAKLGDKIFDSHVGSASSLIACIEEGFDYVGCELDKDYYKSACERIEIYKSQLKLF